MTILTKTTSNKSSIQAWFAIIILMSLFPVERVVAEIPVRISANLEDAVDIAYNSTDDEFLAVWTEWVPSGSIFTLGPVLGQRIDGDGTLIGTPFTIFSVGAEPAIAYNTQRNEYLVACSNLGVLTRRVSSSGQLIDALQTMVANAGEPRVLYNAISDEYLVLGAALEENPASSGFCDIKIFSRRVRSSGSAIGNTNNIVTQSHGICADGAIYAVDYAPITSGQTPGGISTPTGRYLLAIDYPGDLMMLDSHGAPLATLYNPQSSIYYNSVPFQLSKLGITHDVDVAFGYWNDEPTFLVVWSDRQQTHQGQTWTGVWGGLVDAKNINYLTTQGVANTTFPISFINSHLATPVTVKEWKPKADYNSATKKFMITWRETPGSDPQNDTQVNHIRANSIDANNLPPQTFNVVLSRTNGDENPQFPAIAANSKTGGAFVAWEDWRNNTTTKVDLYGATMAAPVVESLTLIEPNGGEKWYVGSQQEVWWGSQNFNDPAKIEYSTDNGSTWKLLSASTTDKTFPWTIPNEPSSNCLVRVSDAADGTPSDVSDARFSILKAGLNITAPDGGEVWQVGSQQQVTWTSQNIPDNDVTIELSTNNGLTYTPIGVHTNNQPSESYPWTVPNSPSTQCRIRISLQIGGVNVGDVSSSTFTIGSLGNTPTGKNITVTPGTGIEMKFDDVTGAGNTTLNTSSQGQPPPNGFFVFPTGAPIYYSINTTASFTGNIEICIEYDDTNLTLVEESKLKLYVFEVPPGNWVDITFSVDVTANIICGRVNHLTDFALMLGPSHFTFSYETGDSYSIVIDQALLNETALENGDEIGVFTPAELCVGAVVWDGTTPLALTAWADDSQTPNVDGYIPGEKMSFRIWDENDDSDTDFLATTTYSAGNGNFADGAFARISSLEAVSYATQTLGLEQGWSWISFNVRSEFLSMEKVMADMTNLVIVVDGAGNFYIPNVINSIGDWKMTEGYKIYVSAYNEVGMSGPPVLPTTPINLNAGWEFVSYLPAASQSAETAVASILSQLAIIKNDAGNFFIPNVINSLGNMNPGEGYKLFLNSAATLLYSQGGSLAKRSESTPSSQSALPQHFRFKNGTGESYAIVVQSLEINGSSPNQKDEIAVFTEQDLCVGAGIWDGNILALSAWADNVQTEEADGFGENQSITFKYWDSNLNQEFVLTPDFHQGSGTFGDGPYAVVTLEKSQVPGIFSLAQNYPNPFNAGTVISYQIPVAGKVMLKIYNVLGQEVATLIDENQAAGLFQAQWQGQDNYGNLVPSGIYLYKLTAGTYSAIQKAAFVK